MSRAANIFFWLVLLNFTEPAFAAETGQRGEVAIQSPDERVRCVLEMDEQHDALTYSITRDGAAVIEASPLVVKRSGTGVLGAGTTIKNVEERTIDETRKMPWGKTSQIRDYCRAATVRLKSKDGIEWDVEVRAYNGGVAFRYGIPKQERIDEFVIESEATEFDLRAIRPSCSCHSRISRRRTRRCTSASYSPSCPGKNCWPRRCWRFGKTAGRRRSPKRGCVVLRGCIWKGRGKRVLVCFVRGSRRCRRSRMPSSWRATPHWSPWRVVMLADRAGDLIASDLLLCLNDPAEGDFSWAKPGKTTWPWWNGTIEHGGPSTPDVNFAAHKQYIDFCARHNIAYHAISSVAESRPWYVQSGPPGFDPRPDTDVLTPRPDLDLPRILAYAKEKGVGIRLWVWWKPLSEKLDEAFATYERWGVKGLMIDFMDRDDQEMVEWQERALRTAAKHKLHIQFHGSYKPTGEHVTFPHLFNREGVLNLEYLKWTDSCAPPHNVNVAYTRLLAGPTDYHLGGFRAASRKTFQPRNLEPMVLGTRAHQLALYVVLENPMPMVADVPSAYENQPGFEFLVEVPTTWDETRFVAGEAGEYVVVARRSGPDWYLGGITNWTARELKLPLEFLGEGKFKARLYMDASVGGEQPNEIRQETLEVGRGMRLDVKLAPGGGVAGVLRAK